MTWARRSYRGIVGLRSRVDRSGPKFRCEFDTIHRVKSIGPQNPYEVYCYECNVTAPPGTRKCLHCGGRLSKSKTQPSAVLSIPFEALEEEEALGDGPTRLGGISPMTAVWILLFIGGSLYRLCN